MIRQYYQSVDISKEQVLIFKLNVMLPKKSVESITESLELEFSDYPNIKVIVLSAMFDSVTVQENNE